MTKTIITLTPEGARNYRALKISQIGMNLRLFTVPNVEYSPDMIKGREVLEAQQDEWRKASLDELSTHIFDGAVRGLTALSQLGFNCNKPGAAKYIHNITVETEASLSPIPA
jgi:hypothetical protein